MPSASDLLRLGHIVLTDFGPSFSILLSIFALGAWALGLQFGSVLHDFPDYGDSVFQNMQSSTISDFVG